VAPDEDYSSSDGGNGPQRQVKDPLAPTDTGNAKRLVRLHGTNLRYCHPWGAWLAFDGSRWKADDTAQVDRWAKDAVRSIAREAENEENDKHRTALLTHALKSQHAQRHRAMIDLARSEDGVPILPEHLDADPMLLTVANGTIELATGKFREHRRDDLIAKLAGVRYAVGATCPTFEKFLERIVPDPDVRGYLQRAFGYCLSGDVSAEVLFFAHGGGANGKSTLLNSMLKLWGDYATRAPSELLLASRSDRHPTEKTVLHGRRLAVCYEANEGRKFDLAVVKALTGGDPVTARGMRQDFWTFQPQHKLWLAANAKPIVAANDEATWRRIQCIPFEVTIPEVERDPLLQKKLAAELSGILNWALVGCSEWLRAGGGKQGLGTPSKVREATEDYRVQEDIIGTFVADLCVLLPTARTTKSDLYKEFKRWAEDNDELVLTKHDFNARIAQVCGVASNRTGKARRWVGICVRTATVQEEINSEACA
jgi:putative DNA primase/helicase